MDPIHKLQAEICPTLSHSAPIAMLPLLAEEARDAGHMAWMAERCEAIERTDTGSVHPT